MRPEFIVAVKEFKDYLTSKRFLLIFAVLLVMCIAAVIAGVSSYNSQLSTYNQEITRAATRNATAGGFSFQPQMPSMMLIFRSFSTSFIIVGWLLAIGIGFDLISKEKESGSLKLLLARPIFRDSIINGKILGSSAILIISLAATFLVAVALLMFQGIIPAGDDLSRLVVFFADAGAILRLVPRNSNSSIGHIEELDHGDITGHRFRCVQPASAEFLQH